MTKKTDAEVGEDIAEECTKTALSMDVKVTKNALYFRQELAHGTGTLHDGRKVEIEAASNINGDSMLIGVKVKGSKDWHTYVFGTQEMIQNVLKDYEARFPKEQSDGELPKEAKKA